jgi:acetyltransferase-like isoleucine patch superfamily enzyme
MATIFSSPYYGRTYLSNLNTKGYIAPSAIVHHNNVRFGHNVFIGDRVVIYQFKDGGPVEFDDRVQIFGESFIQTGSGGNIQIGEKTDIHPRCQISAYKSGICIGSQVQVAPNCAFYPYNHGMMPGKSMREQPLQSKGDIIIGDGAWLGYGVIVLDGARIGKGAVVGAGSVVTDNIPDGCIAVGVPARVVNRRDDIPTEKVQKNIRESK